MSVFSNNVISPNISSLERIVGQQSSQIEQLINIYSSNNKREFDQVTKQKVNISYDETKKRYRFEIQKPENDIFLYQVWKKNNEQMNSDRVYYYEKLRNWIESFKIYLQKDNYTPTTLIEINNIHYPTVLVDAGIEIRNDVDYCVFYFENKSIITNVITDMPKSGLFDNVRFDIDDYASANYTINDYSLYGTYSYNDEYFTVSKDQITWNSSSNSYESFYLNVYPNGNDIVIEITMRGHSTTYKYKLVPSDNKIYRISLSDYNYVIETFVKTYTPPPPLPLLYGTWTKNKNGIIHTVVINQNNNVTETILGSVSYGVYYPDQSKIVWSANGMITDVWNITKINNTINVNNGIYDSIYTFVSQ